VAGRAGFAKRETRSTGHDEKSSADHQQNGGRMAGKIEINTELCKGCEYCVTACPVKIIRITHKTNTHAYHFAETVDMGKCTGCALCAKVCPDLAIEVWRDVPAESKNK
jgi:2-oxoglutarate ferredoxin oxidoreductase subunit delta